MQVFPSNGRDRFARLSAHAKGFLTRLLMKTDKIQGLVKNIKVRTLANFTVEERGFILVVVSLEHIAIAVVMFLVPGFIEHEISAAHINLRQNGCNSSSDELNEFLNLTKLDLKKGFDLLLLILFDIYLSNRPQVSMVYRLINHAGCW